ADVEKLEQAILQWAVMGKLVAQCPDDEPASVLLERIAAEKVRLVKEGKIRKGKKLGAVSAEDTPFDLPENWEWTYFGQVSTVIHYGYTASSDPNLTDVRMLRITDIQNNQVNWKTVPGCVIDNKEVPKYQLQDNDILIARTGGTIGKSYLVQDLDVVSVFASYLIRAVPPKAVNAIYIKRFLESAFYWRQLTAKSKGTGQPNVNATSLSSLLLPLPPLAEQKRIVAKVDALFEQTRALKARLETAGTVRDRLQGAAVGRLSGAQSPDETQAAWRQVEAMFDHIHTTPEHIDSLKQTILQLAVMGRLVPQDPNDEPASVLLERIAAEKARLVKEGKIRKGKKLGKISAEDQPFDLPPNWRWCRWNEVSLQIGDVDHKMPKAIDSGIPYVSPRDFTPSNGIDFENAKKISGEDFLRLSRKIQPQRGDIIFPRYGTIGVNRLVETDIDFLASYSCAVIKNLKGFVDPLYVFFYSLSPLVGSEIEKYINKTTQPNVGVRSIKHFMLPLPPFKEQTRIVAKVDELLALCDQVAAGLVSAEAARTQLLDAVLAQS
ncbi:MAG: restriction endonuclease subunit S, partial [Anaerolineae bacterium]|nr:restriction endonuclease subunit S [Anaerolineae bacterium]